MEIIAVGALKGGTGKTVTLFNLAGLLAEQYKVLLIDCDPQANLSSNIGIDVNSDDIKNVINIFRDNTPLNELIYKTPNKELKNLDIIPSNINLTATEFEIVSKVGRENILKTFIKDNYNELSKYDYVLIDTNPSMGIINQNAFLAANSIILISDVSINGLRGVELFIALWASARRFLNKEDNLKALILNNFDKRTKLAYELVDYCNETTSIKDIVLRSIIPASIQIKNTEIKQSTINCLYNGSPIYEAYKEVLNELKGRGIF